MFSAKTSYFENALSRKMRICNRRGLHARASAKFVKVAASYDAHVLVEKDGVVVGGNSIMGLMMLAASSGSILIIRASGKQAKNVLDALERLIKDRFGEEY